MGRMYPELIEAERRLFEAEAEPYGFDLTRIQCAAPEPWSEYSNAETGHRWGGWLAARSLSSNSLERERLRQLVADNAWACTFQTMSQYRQALMATLGPNARVNPVAAGDPVSEANEG